ncbi:MAG: sulfatase [Myxococcota bacterium]
MRRALWMALLLAACDDEPETVVPTPEERPAETTPQAPEPEPTPTAPTPEPAAAPTHLDLMGLAHLADVDREGLFIDFGTQARFKYTSGNWNSGWGKDAVAGEHSYSRFGAMGRVYFDVREPSALTIRMKVRNIGRGPLLSFMNGQTLREQTPEPGEFRDVVIEVPEEHVRAGENYLLLRGTERRNVEDEEVSFEVAEMHIGPGERSDGWEAPRGLRGRVTIGERARDALKLNDLRMSWYAEVPPSGALRIVHGGEGTLEVTATPEGGSSTELLSAEGGSSWETVEPSLEPLAGKLVRFDVRAEGEVALADLRIVVPQPEPSTAAVARNVVVLTIDTLRASKLRPYNRRSRVRTPAIDRLAREGTVFERAQTAENWTKPAVASILTSLFPATHGAKNDSSRLPHSALTLGEIYQSHGFATASFLANGYVSRAFGFDQGWDHYTNYIRERRNTNASNVFGEAIDWIEEHKEERFFVYIQTIDPHVPYDPPDNILRLYDARTDYSGQVQNRRTHLLLEDAKRNPPRVEFTESDVTRLEALHDGEIDYHDRHLAEFLDKLDELGLAENTIFVVTSDHGEEFHEHGSWGHGHSIFQELLHVPLIVRQPGVAQAGARVPHVVSTMGIAPTVLQATGHAVPEVFEGRTLTRFLRGGSEPGPWVAFSDFQENRRVVRGGDWKLVLRSSLTYVLFDLARDPGERQEVNPRRHPIAMRYLRILSGQLLGAGNRANWLTGGSGQSGVQAETTEMTLELCQQLVALGYMDCTSQFPDAI